MQEPEPMTDAELYRRAHELVRRAKLSRWRISRTASDGFWRLTLSSRRRRHRRGEANHARLASR